MLYSLKWWQRVIIYAVFGWAIEVFFTGVSSAISGDVKTTGHTYLWMLCVWGFGSLVFEKAVSFLRHHNIKLFYRIVMYAFGIMTFELIAGVIIQFITGIIPWDYSSSGTSPGGYVRLDYLPFWMICGMLMETFILFIKKVRIQK